MKKVSRVAFFQNKRSQHAVLHQFTLSLQKALLKLGIESSTYDILQQPDTEILAHLVHEPPDCTLGFNVVLPESLFYDITEIPHVALIVDSVTYYPELERCPHSITAFAEEDSLQFARLHNLLKTFYFPHAIDGELASSKTDQDILKSKRDLEVVFAGSYIDKDAPFSLIKEYLSKELIEEIDTIIESTLSSNTTSHLLALVTLFEKKPSYRQELLKCPLPAADIFSLVELAIRGRDRTRLLQSIQGYDLHIFGAEDEVPLWKKALGNKKQLHFHKPVPYEELYTLFLRSKVVINSIPTIKRGYHERLFLAAAAGATVATSNCAYIHRGPFTEPAIVPYRSPEYSLLSTSLQKALQDEERRLQALIALKKMIFKEHTWDVRAQYLLQVLAQLLTPSPS